jgi:uncharacterized protein
LPAQNIPPRPQPARTVNDYANLLDDFEENQLERKLRDYMDSTSTQIIIVTINSLEGAPVEDYTATLGYKWGVGQKENHNGVVILVSKNDRKGYIATGYGVEDGLNTSVCKQIYQEILVPNFKAGTFYNGFDLATTEMINILSGKFQNTNKHSKNADDGFTVGIFLLIVVLFFIFIIIMARKNSSHISRRGVSSPTFWGPTIGGGGGWSGGGGSSGGGGFDFGGGDFSGGGAGGDW